MPGEPSREGLPGLSRRRCQFTGVECQGLNRRWCSFESLSRSGLTRVIRQVAANVDASSVSIFAIDTKLVRLTS